MAQGGDEAHHRLQEELRVLERRAATRMGRAYSRRRAAAAAGLSEGRISEWLPTDRGRSAKVPRDEDDVWSLVTLWARWAHEEPRDRAHWNALVRDARRRPAAAGPTPAAGQTSISIADAWYEWPPTDLDDHWPRLSVDLTLQNRTSGTLLVSRLSFACTASEQIVPFRLPEPAHRVIDHAVRAALPFSATIHVKVPRPDPEPFAVEQKMSQLIEPGEFDRIEVLLDFPVPRAAARHYLYLARLEVLVAASPERAESEQLLLAVPGHPRLEPPESLAERIAAFAASVREVRQQLQVRSRKPIMWAAIAAPERVGSRIALAQDFRSATCQDLDECFWHPRATVDECLDRHVDMLRRLQDMLGTAPRVLAPGDGQPISPADLAAHLDELRRMRAHSYELLGGL